MINVRSIKSLVLAAFAGLTFIYFAQSYVAAQKIDSADRLHLGARLFSDDRFTSPNGDLPSSCSHCHLFKQDPQGTRAYSDFLARSWVPSRWTDQRREGIRNAPTIFDADEMPRLHYDGEFDSLEELVKGTLSGRTLGWMPGEQAQAFKQVYDVLIKDNAEGEKAEVPYRDEFKKVYRVDLNASSTSQTIDLVADAVSAYVRSLKTKRDSAYDRFIQANGLDARPGADESTEDFAARMTAKIAALESKKQLKLSTTFSTNELKGLKIFYRVKGERSVGNCVLCHVPPLFTDHSFHNIGISQVEFDKVHGEGSFASKPIPGPMAQRPSTEFREIPSLKKPNYVDLGYWNFVKLNDSDLRRAGESDDKFLERMIATFKTPTLRNLSFTQPYMHNGAYTTLESTLEELLRLSSMARAGQVRSADDGLARIKIGESDIPLLIAFLNSLNDDLN